MISLRRLWRRLLGAHAARGATALLPSATPLGIVTSWGTLDDIDVDPSGLIRISGWSHAPSDDLRPPRLSVGNATLPVLKHYRTRRPDVPGDASHLLNLPGFVFEYLVPEALYGSTEKRVKLGLDGRDDILIDARWPFARPDYHALFHSRQVLGRGDIYGFGPPNTEPNPEVLAMLEATSGTVLDFGSGGGALVGALRRRGREAFGIEIDREPVRAAMPEAGAP